MENKLYVIYVGVAGVDDVSDYVDNVKKVLTPRSIEGEFIIIPVQRTDSKIECINPQYITDENLILKNTKLMNELEEHLKFELKNKKNEKN